MPTRSPHPVHNRGCDVGGTPIPELPPEVEELLVDVVADGFAVYCCGARVAPHALLAAYEWADSVDLVTIRSFERITAARVPTPGGVNIFAPETVVWAYEGASQPALRALLNLVHPSHPEPSRVPTSTCPAPPSLQIPRAQQRPMTIRLPAPERAGVRAARLATVMPAGSGWLLAAAGARRLAPVITARADVVGSLLRPPGLLTARERLERGEISPPEFKRIEDAAVTAAIRLQGDAGLDVVTDGEMRRLSFQSQFTEAVEGFSDWDLDAFRWGDWRGDEVGDKLIERPPIAVLERLRRRRFLSAEEFTYARGTTGRIVKVTLPSPSLFANFYDPQRSRGAYPSLESFLAEVTEILREEVDELVRLGCQYIQLDAPHYPLLLDPAYRDFYAGRGWPAQRWLDLGVELDNVVIGTHPGVTFGFHLCRGNQQSRWLVEGGYDWLAREVFPRVRAQRLLLEYDDERSGGFEPLAAVPEGAIAVLGLVTTKTGRRETVEELATRLHEAARHLPLEHLALSPQCGFATSILGNALSPADQEAKLRTIVATAEHVWDWK